MNNESQPKPPRTQEELRAALAAVREKKAQAQQELSGPQKAAIVVSTKLESGAIKAGLIEPKLPARAEPLVTVTRRPQAPSTPAIPPVFVLKEEPPKVNLPPRPTAPAAPKPVPPAPKAPEPAPVAPQPPGTRTEEKKEFKRIQPPSESQSVELLTAEKARILALYNEILPLPENAEQAQIYKDAYEQYSRYLDTVLKRQEAEAKRVLIENTQPVVTHDLTLENGVNLIKNVDAFHENGQLKSRGFSNGSTEYYDENGKLLRTEFANGKIAHYDAEGRVQFEDKYIKATKRKEASAPEKGTIFTIAGIKSALSAVKELIENNLGKVAALATAGGVIIGGTFGGKKAGEWQGERDVKAAEAKAQNKYGKNAEYEALQQKIAEAARLANLARQEKAAVEAQRQAEAKAAQANLAQKEAELAATNARAAEAATQAAADKQLLKTQGEKAVLDAQIEAAKKSLVKTPEERLAEIRAKKDRGERLTADEASILNRSIVAGIARRGYMPRPPQPQETVSQERSFVTPMPPQAPPTSGWGGHISTMPPPAPMTPATVIIPKPPSAPTSSTLSVSDAKAQQKLLETLKESAKEKGEIMDGNLYKVFADDPNALKNWAKLQKENAYTFMNKPENKVPKEQKALWDYLQFIKKTTKLSPKLSDQNIGAYLDLAFINAAGEGKMSTLKYKE